MEKSYSEQLEPRPEKYKPIICDRFIQGLYLRRSEFFPVPSVHKDYVLNRIPRGAHYDSADDGPEVEIIRRVWPTQIFEQMTESPYEWFQSRVGTESQLSY